MENNSIGNAERNGKGVKFERIRRITGYLVGAVDRWNDAKKAELNDRVISTHNKSYTGSARGERSPRALLVPFPVSWTVKMKKKQKETQDILSYHTQAAGCSDKARAKASGGRQPIEECGRTGL